MNAPIRHADSKYTYPVAFQHWGSEEWSAIHRVLASGQFTMAGEVEAFEAEFAAYHGMRHAIMVNSGSSANLIAARALVEHCVMPKEVTIPALAWSTTFAPFVQHDIDLVPCDPDSTWNVPDCDVVCPILGNASYMDTYHVLFVDNCESIGARCVDDRLCGTTGLVNTFSFYWSHQLSAVEGGAILVDDDGLARTCRLLRSHGWTRNVDRPRSFDEEYRFENFGYNLRPLELHAAIAREQLKKLDRNIAARTANFDYFRDSARSLPLTFPTIHGKPSYFGIHFTLPDNATRARLVIALRANGIDCRPPCAGSLRKQPYGARWADQQTPNADRIHDTGMMLGNPPFPANDLIDRAIGVMREVL